MTATVLQRSPPQIRIRTKRILARNATPNGHSVESQQKQAVPNDSFELEEFPTHLWPKEDDEEEEEEEHKFSVTTTNPPPPSKDTAGNLIVDNNPTGTLMTDHHRHHSFMNVREDLGRDDEDLIQSLRNPPF